jgi:hypothetical protein
LKIIYWPKNFPGKNTLAYFAAGSWKKNYLNIIDTEGKFYRTFFFKNGSNKLKDLFLDGLSSLV